MSNEQYPSIGSDNGLAPTRRQAIMWANDDMVYWRIYASLGLNELTINVMFADFLSLQGARTLATMESTSFPHINVGFHCRHLCATFIIDLIQLREFVIWYAAICIFGLQLFVFSVSNMQKQIMNFLIIAFFRWQGYHLNSNQLNWHMYQLFLIWYCLSWHLRPNDCDYINYIEN